MSVSEMRGDICHIEENVKSDFSTQNQRFFGRNGVVFLC